VLMEGELTGDMEEVLILKILIVGCGLIGELHAITIKSSGDHSLILAEPRREIMEETARKVDPVGCFIDYKEALSKEEPDAAFICSPNSMHAQHTIDALNAGCHVLVEKPMATSSKDAKEMCRVAKENDKIMMIGYGMRFNKCVNKIKDIILSGEFGNPISARVVLAKPETLTEAKTRYRKSYATGGGIIYDYSHELDYCGLFFGNPVKCVCFKKLAINSSEVTCDDNSDMIVQYDTDVNVVYHFDYIQEHGHGQGRWIGIVFEQGFVETNFVTEMKTYDNNGDIILYHPHNPSRWWSLETELKVFCKLCAGESLAYKYATGENSLKIIELVEALYKSANTGKIIHFER
jgi:predicted dehydrogenase